MRCQRAVTLNRRASALPPREADDYLIAIFGVSLHYNTTFKLDNWACYFVTPNVLLINHIITAKLTIIKLIRVGEIDDSVYAN